MTPYRIRHTMLTALRWGILIALIIGGLASAVVGFDTVLDWCIRTFGLCGMTVTIAIIILLLAGMAKAEREMKDYERGKK